MLYEYIKSRYEPNEPIFSSDIDLPVSNVNLRQMFKVLCDSEKIKRFDQGVYYLPKESRLNGGVPLSADTVARYKYISRNGKVDGYYSGYTFANQIGVTTQVPYLTEIVTNNASAKVREINMRGRRVLLRKPRVPVTEGNCRVLQLLDFLAGVDKYSDEDKTVVAERTRQYIKLEKVQKKDIDKYISEYPDKVFRSIYEMGLYDVFA